MTGRRRVHTQVRLLIVDEHPITLKTLPPSLRQYGYHCAVGSTAAEAIKAITTHRAEAVVLEWLFRDGSGVGLAARLRAAAHGRTLVIIALSVADEPDGFREREGVDGYFVKPASVVLIDRAIRPLLRSMPRSALGT